MRKGRGKRGLSPKVVNRASGYVPCLIWCVSYDGACSLVLFSPSSLPTPALSISQNSDSGRTAAEMRTRCGGQQGRNAHDHARTDDDPLHARPRAVGFFCPVYTERQARLWMVIAQACGNFDYLDWRRRAQKIPPHLFLCSSEFRNCRHSFASFSTHCLSFHLFKWKEPGGKVSHVPRRRERELTSFTRRQRERGGRLTRKGKGKSGL